MGQSGKGWFCGGLGGVERDEIGIGVKGVGREVFRMVWVGVLLWGGELANRWYCVFWECRPGSVKYNLLFNLKLGGRGIRYGAGINDTKKPLLQVKE